MKHAFPFILAALLLWGCDNAPSQNESDAADSTAQAAAPAPAPSFSDTLGIAGAYGTEEPTDCGIAFRIGTDAEGYTYEMSTTGQEAVSGRMDITVGEDGATYFVFEGLGEEGIVDGMQEGTGFVIQNYGNAMNSFIHFPACDVKYLHFVKN